MKNSERARAILEENQQLTCVLCCDETIYTATARGIAPMMEWIERGEILNGFSVADRVVGRAAAFLFVLAGIREVYAAVVSEPALAVLEKYAIPCSYEKRVPHIINRTGDGFCPMETAVWEIDDPEHALQIIRQTQLKLRGK